jgi:hypothetical protein
MSVFGVIQYFRKLTGRPKLNILAIYLSVLFKWLVMFVHNSSFQQGYINMIEQIDTRSRPEIHSKRLHEDIQKLQIRAVSCKGLRIKKSPA